MSKAFDLTGKVAVITGGANGIGASISRVFAEHGARVYILDLEQANGTALAESIRLGNGLAEYYHCDIANHKDVMYTFKLIYEDRGQIDILINNAGISHIGNVEETTPEDMDRLYQVNIKGAYSCLQSAVKYMKEGSGGSIVNMASVASVMGLKDRFAYSMSKGAIYTMTFSIAKDYLEDNIRCNAIGPARVHTPFVDDYLAKSYPGKEKEMFDQLSKTQPIGRMGHPDEIAHLALYLCSDQAAFVTGSFYPIDGGFMTLNT